ATGGLISNSPPTASATAVRRYVLGDIRSYRGSGGARVVTAMPGGASAAWLQPEGMLSEVGGDQESAQYVHSDVHIGGAGPGVDGCRQVREPLAGDLEAAQRDYLALQLAPQSSASLASDGSAIGQQVHSIGQLRTDEGFRAVAQIERRACTVMI